ncbi:hypothetical protein, partial [Enterococcus casseliflavus]|uniref:hypothetical protein n=1 Tax=Enterococcus casseliflavus TaxID=37734 RepID=UPI003D1055C7
FEINSSEKADDEEAYPNLRSQLWFAAQLFLKEGGSLPENADLESQLLAPIYTFDAKGRRKVESKADIKLRIGESPDS